MCVFSHLENKHLCGKGFLQFVHDTHAGPSNQNEFWSAFIFTKKRVNIASCLDNCILFMVPIETKYISFFTDRHEKKPFLILLFLPFKN